MTIDDVKQLVLNKAAQYGINPGVALAQMGRESGWRQDVIFGPYVGGAGERGISQFTPGTWARFGSGPHTNAYNPELALDAWGRYMTYLLGLFNSDYASALTGYNGGEGHLTDPDRHGPPSAAALEYGRTLAAAASSGGGSSILDPGAAGSGVPWVLLGAGALILFIALRD